MPRLFWWLLAVGCSLVLTMMTLVVPPVPTDWARPGSTGLYRPPIIEAQWPSYAVQVALWLVMLAALVAALSPKNWGIRRGEFETLPYTSLFLIPLLTLIGFALRLHNLTALPLIVDEIGFAARASDILHGQHIPIFAAGHNGNPAVYSWLLAGVMSIFGQNVFALRLLSLLAGTLAIPAAYALGYSWWSRGVGLAAAAFVATFPAHIFFSQLSLYNSIDPTLSLLALAALARAVRRGKANDWVLVGIYAGTAQYFYHGSRLLLVMIVVYVAAAISRGAMHCAPTKTAAFRNVILALLPAFIILTLPRFAPMFAGGMPLTGNRETMRLPADLGENSLRALLAWVGQPDLSPFWLSDRPLLEWPVLLAAGVGLLLCIRRWSDPRSLTLLISLPLTTIFGAAIWTAAPLYVRYMTALPATALLVAIGIDAVKNSTQRIKFIPTALVLLICLQGAGVSWHDDRAVRVSASTWAADALAKQAATLPDTVPLALVVPDDFDSGQAVTLVDYLAAYGVRRRLALSAESEVERRAWQLTQLGDEAVVLGLTYPNSAEK